jgi:hypothetical protein
MTMPNDPLPPVVDLRGIETGELDRVTIEILMRIAAGDEAVKCIAITRKGQTVPSGSEG